MMQVMKANLPEKVPHRIAVILGSSSSGRNLLDQVLPLLGADRNVEMQGVFLEEAEVQHAAELPFVQELCRVTFSVREFNSDHFEHALNLRMRTARRALSVLARRTGVAHTFRNVRGSTVSLLRETAVRSDITLFEPAHLRVSAMGPASRSQEQRRRIVLVVDDPDTGRMALAAATRLAGGASQKVTVLLTPSACADEAVLQQKLLAALPSQARVRRLPEAGFNTVIEAVRAEAARILVLGTSEEMLAPRALQHLRDQLRCPICLVRRWGELPNQLEIEQP